MESTLFDAEFMRKLETLRLLARRVFRNTSSGERTTMRRGASLEFSDYRRYQPGDDFRYIDWNVYSRLDRLFLKVFTAEEDLTIHLLVDTSQSMRLGDPAKLDYARRVAAKYALGGHRVSAASTHPEFRRRSRRHRAGSRGRRSRNRDGDSDLEPPARWDLGKRLRPRPGRHTTHQFFFRRRREKL